MKAIQFTILFFLLNLSSIILSQPQLTISTNASITYTPMKDISHFYIAWEELDSKNFNLSWEVEARNYISNYDVVYISVTKINTQIDVPGGQHPIYLTRKLEIIPVTIGYERIFATSSSLKPYLGIGLSLVRASTNLDDGDDNEGIWESNEGNTYGFELKFGVVKKVILFVNIRAEIQYNFHTDAKLYKHKDVIEYNLSGLGLYFGTEIEIF